MKRAFSRHLFLSMAAVSATLFAFSAQGAPQWEAPSEVSQGHAFVVRAKDSAPFEASVIWRDKKIPLTVTQKNGTWEGSVMLAVPIDAKGVIPLQTVAKGVIPLQTAAKGAPSSSGKAQAASPSAPITGPGKKVFSIQVLAVPWHEERITVAPKYVTPPPEVTAQIKRDQEHTAKVLSVIRPEQEWTLPFQRPVKGTISGSFGGRRVLNGQPRSPHKGTDMRGATSTPVLAVADGVVVLAELQYYSGNVIYIDHGQGVLSMYGHLSAFDVSPGQRVKRGQAIGKVGATGRVTGPHLHLGLLVQGVAVDAMPLYTTPLAVTGGPTKEEPRPGTPAATPAANKKDGKAARLGQAPVKPK